MPTSGPSPLCVPEGPSPLSLQGFVKVYCKILRPLFHQYRGQVDPFLEAASRQMVSALPHQPSLPVR